MKILVLDDSMMRHAFFKMGFAEAQLVPALTARQAVDLLRAEAFDAVFLDHDLEGSGPECGDGRDVTTAIRAMVDSGEYLSANAVHCVHSFNDEYGPIMCGHLSKAGLNVRRCVNAWRERRAMAELVHCGTWSFPHREVVDALATSQGRPDEDDE
jgi:hypothetical protein